MPKPITKDDALYLHQTRLEAWAVASSLVKPIIEEHGLEKYVTGTMFQHSTTFTSAEQHVDLIMRVADWLLYKENM